MSIIAVGDFDGVHLGHRSLLQYLVSLGKQLGIPTAVITFDRNSKAFFHGSLGSYLTDPSARTRMILEEGVDRVFVVPFDEAFSQVTSEEFLALLRDRYGCTHLVGGTDFRFGCGGKGRLNDGAVVCGIKQHLVPLKIDMVKISSTFIRDSLRDGSLDRVNAWLGYSYFVSGPVVEGKHLGRTIGFPTINLNAPEGQLLPKNGVYVTKTEIDGVVHPSVTNVGIRPTVENGMNRNIETHLLNFDGDFYGKTATVHFLSLLREEQHFPDLGALMRQICKDRDAAYTWHKMTSL